VLTAAQARVLLEQYIETAAKRRWQLLAVAIMRTHVHVVVGVEGDPRPGKVLGDFKAWGARALNRQWARPASQTWWTEEGSKRKLPHAAAVRAAVEYLRRQSNPLVVWVAGEGDAVP
jgi:REP element-mobilizing transposase RayT